MGYTEPNVSNYAMKHGLAMEPHAKRIYERIMKKSHKQFSARDSGLVVYRPKQYIAASPDMVSVCMCCGEGVLEIKSPWSCRDSIPTYENDAGLVKCPTDVKSILSHDSPHMYQIQGQMACMQVAHADIFVYTSYGYHLERIKFNPEMWANMLERFDYFWCKHIAPEIISGSLAQRLTPDVDMEIEHAYAKGTATGITPSTSTCPNTKTSILTAPVLPLVYLCAICGIDCDESSEMEKPSIECTKCKMWLHFDCAGLNSSDIPDEDDVWVCPHCCNL